MKSAAPFIFLFCATLIARTGLCAEASRAPGVANGGNPAILTVDMKKLFEAHPKTIEAQKQIDSENNKSKNDPRDERLEKGTRLQSEVAKLDQSFAGGELAGDALEQARKSRAEKVEALKALAGEIRKAQMVREKESQEKSARLRSEIIEDINKAIAATPALSEATFLLDKSGPSLSGVPVVAYSSPRLDRTEAVLKQLGIKKSVEGSAEAEPGKGLNVAVLDMKRIFAGYNKTREGAEKINAERRAASKEYAELAEKAASAAEAVKKLDAQMADLSATERAKRMQDRPAKAALAQTLDQNTRQYQASHARQFQEESEKMRKEIVDDINRAVAEGAKADGRVDLILDASATSMNGVSFVVRHEGIPDWTEAVISTLNGVKTGGKGSLAGRPSSSVSTSELRFAVIDMKRVFETSQDTKAVAKAIDEAKAKAAAADPADRQAKEKDVQDLLLKMQAGIAEKMTKALADAAGKVGCQMVLDASGSSLNGVPVVTMRKPLPDLSSEIVAALGGTASASPQITPQPEPKKPRKPVK